MGKGNNNEDDNTDDSKPRTTADFSYYAVGAHDGFLKGSRRLNGPWETLDDKLQLRDVAVIKLSVSSRAQPSSIVNCPKRDISSSAAVPGGNRRRPSRFLSRK